MASLRIAASHLWAVIVTTLLWLMAWGTTVLLIYIPLIPIVIIAALLNIPYQEWIVTGLFLVGPIYLLRFLSTPAVRFGLRISPLPSGRTTRQWVPATLIAGWGFALALAVANDTDWQSLFTLCVAAPAAGWYLWNMNRAWEGAPKGRFVLFLRRFGKSADRLVGSAIRGAVPDGATLAFLVGRENTGESWDPFLVGYEGLQSVPLYLSADDQEWVERVRFLVAKADAIVIDVSDWSDAMEVEARIIRESSAAQKTVVLSRFVGNTPDVAAREVIKYRRSWRAAYDRIFWGFVASVGFPLVIHATATSREHPDPVLAVPLVALWVWLFVRPLMDKQSAGTLKAELGKILSK
jgi:hypothetical protein